MERCYCEVLGFAVVWRPDEANVYLQYKFRKVFFTAGYSRLVQGFSASTLAPEMLSTYYVGISRWFNFF